MKPGILLSAGSTVRRELLPFFAATRLAEIQVYWLVSPPVSMCHSFHFDNSSVTIRHPNR